MDTIFALSSGSPPAGIAVVRVSGPDARSALSGLAGKLPEPRVATFVLLRGQEGEELDRALVLWLPGPGTATGEDVAELHLHGGRAVVAAVENALAALSGLRRAEAGEFTRRAFLNGRIDLAEAEGLADLLSAETEGQRRAAIAVAGGALSRRVEEWRVQVLALSAAVEAVLDFGDEDDVEELPPSFSGALASLSGEIGQWLARPAAERLKDGIRIVLSGPPNAGKSSLFNALLETEAAIVTDIPGTTRDVIERPVVVRGVPFVLVDTAGLRVADGDPIEAVGIARAEAELARADIALWLGPEGRGPEGAYEIAAKADIDKRGKTAPFAQVSATTREGVGELWDALVSLSRTLLPAPGEVALNRRQRDALAVVASAIADASDETRPLLVAEQLRIARAALDRIVGRTSTEDMLDALFGLFCIGK